MAVFTIEGEEVIIKTVGDGGFSGRIYVPKSWQGETVKIVRLSRLENRIDTGENIGGEVPGGKNEGEGGKH